KGGGLPFFLSSYWAFKRSTLLFIAESHREAENLVSDLSFFLPDLKDRILYYAGWESHPFDTYSPHPEIIMSRLKVLYHLLQERDLLVISTVDALMQRVIPREVLIDRTLFLKEGGEIDRDKLIRELSENGYQRVETVEDKGTFSVKGGILDLFTPLSPVPYRLEFVGDEIETIRTFDPATQRSLQKDIPEIAVIPAREIIYGEPYMEQALEAIKRHADEEGVKKGDRDQILEYVKHRIYFSGVDYYLSFFYSKLSHLLDYFPECFDLVYSDKTKIEDAMATFEEECERDFQEAMKDKRISAPVSDFYSTKKEMEIYLSPQKYIHISPIELLSEKEKNRVVHMEDNQDIRLDFRKLKNKSLEMLNPLAEHLKNWRDEGYVVILTAHTKIQHERFRELMEPYGIRCMFLEKSFALQTIHEIRKNNGFRHFHLIFVSGELSSGFRDPDEKTVFITEDEIFGERKKRPSQTAGPSKKAPFISNLAELKIGDPMVHADHGIGLYQGLKRLKTADHENDYVLMEYADNDRLYVPVHRLNVIQPYLGSKEGAVPLDKLGAKGWQKTKSRVKKAIQEIAYELLNLYAARQQASGYSFSPPDPYFHEFEATFPYEETQDQMRAIEEVIHDLCEPKPMDRLVCGDVGYGKTEVAIRAAVKVVFDKKQVALLAPTTLLVDQHYRLFQKRLDPFGIQVVMLSRFVKAAEQKRVVEKIKKGGADIVIGTHRLLSRDIGFQDLGLLIIDEEQRFGVVHKERIKKMKTELDVLTLTATPIPRTLHMSLMGVRDLSVINTPPQDRRAIRTYISKFDDHTIREAILNEIHRGGQVFFLHNRVETISGMTRHLQKLVPEAKIHFAHGQMRETAVEKVMHDFLNQKFNVLVCTTIVGSGIDIPTANTIIIDRADTFGLATLYQLRGRVGRSHERAFAYLLIPGEDQITADAKKRLQAIQGASELGAGFKIASHDLEIRGGGNILGKDQSGHIAAIGFEMYTELLEQTVRELKGESVDLGMEPEMNLKMDAYIDEDYIPDMSEKLVFYRHLSSIQHEEELMEIEEEMRDRFGPIPDNVYHLFELMAIKFYLKKLGIRAIDYGTQRVFMTFSDQTPVDPNRVIELVKTNP
ncbi:MAG: transcription-repair coupling factor, partial [Deltaproteobacteria bacterium]